jgi:hypothetical protein
VTRRAPASGPGVFRVYGLRVQCAFPLPGVAAADDGAPDLRIAWGDAVPTGTDDDGRAVARLTLAGGGGYALHELEGGYRLRFPGLAEFRISRDASSVRVHPDPAADPALIPLLVIGNVMGLLLTLRGDDALHASAVEHAGGAVALFAPRGGGKSTLAAFLCTQGARLVTDDVLLLDHSNDPVLCHYGPREVRLRPGSVMSGRIDEAGRDTPDGRTAYGLDGPRARLPVLRRIVVPRLVRTPTTVRARRLSAPEAHGVLLENPKVEGWIDGTHLRRRFLALARTAAHVPAWEVEIPWGEPLRPELARVLLGVDG